MRRETIALALALLTCGRFGHAQPGQAPSAARLSNISEVRARLGLATQYADASRIGAVKVAVLDYGFEGIGPGRRYLPDDTVVVEHYDPEFVRQFDLGDPEYQKPLEPLNRHGRVMAQIVWAVTGAHPQGPKFFLLNANGPTMLRRAVRYAIEQRVDVILFCGSFEGGGNGDGRGPINRTVADALAADILWINAAGNYGHRVYNGPVRLLRDGYLRLRDGADVAALRFVNRLDENTVTVTLTWNDYREDEDAGTTKDLDLYIEDWAGRRIGVGEKTQVAGDRIAGPNESRNPRERVVLTNLAASPEVATDPDYTYRIRIKAKRGVFSSADRVRVLLTAARDVYLPAGADRPRAAFEFLDATGEGELYPPADHPLVLTVGDTEPSSSVGPTADRRIKPDTVLEDSRAFFTDGEISAGSSNAAAYVAGVVAVLKAAEPGLRPRHLLMLAQQGDILPQSGARARPPLPPTPGLATRPASLAPPPPVLRAWRTPSRARLAELVRAGR
jgi:hypothetical protein